MKNKLLTITLALITASNLATAQDLLDQLYFEQKKETQLVEATFKTLRIGLGHSVETRKQGILEISSYTRYWNVPEVDGVVTEQNNFSSDRMSGRFGLDYAVNNEFSTGIGWANSGVFDAYLKYRVLRQKTGAKKTPISITALLAGSYRSENLENIPLDGDPTSIYDPSVSKTSINLDDGFTKKSTFTGQLLVARKINRDFSVQLSPTVIYRGSTRFEGDPDLHVALGIGGRYKLGKHVSIASDYFYVPKPFALESFETYGAYSLGVNWEVSKVQVQLYLTNTGDYAEDIVITETPVNFNFKDGNLFFGFNFSYVIHIKRAH